jgi:cytochrome P450
MDTAAGAQGATMTTTQTDLFVQIVDYANRANPYPIFAELRKTPVYRAANGGYVISTYREVMKLMHDPRVSATDSGNENENPSFIGMDPPDHDRLRRLATTNFDQTEVVRPSMVSTATELIDRMQGREQVDIVEDFAYPFPVSMICQQLGVPREDEPRFHPWSEALIAILDPRPGNKEAAAQASTEMNRYMYQLVERFRAEPGTGTGLLAGLTAAQGLTTRQIVATGRLLLIAGHETTVNLIANGMLTLLRHPDVLERLRQEPELAPPLVEELLRYEPPVQLDPKYTTLDDIEIAGVTIPKGSRLVLALAAANRDPNRFVDPDRFDPDREDNQHLSFLTGIHYCFGAGLARQETQVALIELSRRLKNPRLVQDPPPYRPNPSLRGPRHLPVAIDGLN